MKMKYRNLFYPVLLLSIGIVFAPIDVYGQSKGKKSPQKERDRPQKVVTMPFIIPSPGAPGKRKVGAARRPNCPWIGDYLTALVPGTNVGLTVSQHPTFWFDIPYGACGLSVEFQLSDIQDNPLYKQIFPIQGTPGIVSIRLPESAPALEIGKPYRWRLTIILDPGAPFDDARGPVVEGAVLRVPLTGRPLQQSLASASPRDRLILYGQKGLWFDLLAGLSEGYRANPKNPQMAQDWRNVLQTVGLNHVVSKPLTPCCSPRLQQ